MARRESSMIVFLMDENGRPYQAHVYGVDVRTEKALRTRAEFVKRETGAARLAYAFVDMSPTCAWILLEKVCPFECELLGTMRMDRPEIMFSTLHRIKGRGTLVQVHDERRAQCHYTREAQPDYYDNLPF